MFEYEFTVAKPLNDDKVKYLKKYLEKTKDFLFKVDNIVFDLSSLTSKICLSKCLDCEKYQHKNCCYGSPYPINDFCKTNLNKIKDDVINSMTTPVLDSIKSNEESIYTKSNRIRTNKLDNSVCLFKDTDENGIAKCAIHSYCLKNGLNYIEYEPYICSLFPLFAIRDTETQELFFFCHDSKTSAFSLYMYITANRPCVFKKMTDTVVNTDNYTQKFLLALNKENLKRDNVINFYNSAIFEQKEVLEYFCGKDKVSDAIKYLIDNAKKLNISC